MKFNYYIISSIEVLNMEYLIVVLFCLIWIWYIKDTLFVWS